MLLALSAVVALTGVLLGGKSKALTGWCDYYLFALGRVLSSALFDSSRPEILMRGDCKLLPVVNFLAGYSVLQMA